MDEYSEDNLSGGSQDEADGAASDSDSEYVAEAAEDSDETLTEGSDSAPTDDSVPSSKRQLTGF